MVVRNIFLCCCIIIFYACSIKNSDKKNIESLNTGDSILFLLNQAIDMTAPQTSYDLLERTLKLSEQKNPGKDILF
jgi:hypothetical protein